MADKKIKEILYDDVYTKILIKDNSYIIRHITHILNFAFDIDDIVSFVIEDFEKKKEYLQLNTFIVNSIHEPLLFTKSIFSNLIFKKYYLENCEDIKFIFIFGSYTIVNELDFVMAKDFVFFPTIFLHEVESDKHYDSIEETIEKNSTSFVSLNNRARYHRTKFIDHIAKYDLWDDISVSYNDPNFNIEEFNHWKSPTILPIDLPINENDTTDINQGNLLFFQVPEEYTNSSLDIVTESNFDEIQFSEKTLRPLYLKKPFIIVGAPKVNLALRDLFGFKLYEKIFDYEYYDKIKFIEDRIDFLCQWMHKNRNLTIDDEIEQIISFNYNRISELKKKSHHYAYDYQGNKIKIQSSLIELLRDKYYIHMMNPDKEHEDVMHIFPKKNLI